MLSKLTLALMVAPRFATALPQSPEFVVGLDTNPLIEAETLPAIIMHAAKNNVLRRACGFMIPPLRWSLERCGDAPTTPASNAGATFEGRVDLV
jgi:hypothetical protein